MNEKELAGIITYSHSLQRYRHRRGNIVNIIIIVILIIEILIIIHRRLPPQISLPSTYFIFLCVRVSFSWLSREPPEGITEHHHHHFVRRGERKFLEREKPRLCGRSRSGEVLPAGNLASILLIFFFLTTEERFSSLIVT